MGGKEPNWEKDYKEACKEDSDVKNFHDNLEAEIEGVINASAEGGLSMDFLRKVTLCLAEKDKRFKNFILEHKKDIWKDRNLRELVDLYEQLNIMTSKFYNKLNNCLGKMKGKLSLLQVALRFIAPADPLPGKAQYSKCKEKLEEFLTAENSFNEEFSELMKSANVQHEQILEKLEAKKKKLDKKLKRVRACRKIFYIIFATVSASFFICAVLAGIMASVPLALIVLTVISNPIISAVHWFSSKLAKYEKTIKVKCEFVDLMQKRTYGGLYELNQITASVERLESSIDLILDSVDLYCKDESNQQDAVENIREEEQRFKDHIDVLRATVDFIGEKRPSEEDQANNTPKAVVEDIRKKQQIIEDQPNTQNVAVEDITKKQQSFEDQTNTQNAVVEDISTQNFEDQSNIHKTVVEDIMKKQESFEDQINIQKTVVEDITEKQQSLEDQTSIQKDIIEKQQSFDDDQTNIQEAVVEDITKKEQRFKDQNQNNCQISSVVEDIMKKHKSFEDQSNIDNAVVMCIMKTHRSFEDQTNIQKAVVEDILKKRQSFKDRITEISNHVNRCNQEIQTNSVVVIFKNIRA